MLRRWGRAVDWSGEGATGGTGPQIRVVVARLAVAIPGTPRYRTFRQRRADELALIDRPAASPPYVLTAFSMARTAMPGLRVKLSSGVEALTCGGRQPELSRCQNVANKRPGPASLPAIRPV